MGQRRGLEDEHSTTRRLMVGSELAPERPCSQATLLGRRPVNGLVCGGSGRPDEVASTRDPRVARHRCEVDLDEVRRRSCCAVRERGGGGGVGANIALATIGDVRRELGDVTSGRDDRQGDVRRTVEGLPQVEVAGRAPWLVRGQTRLEKRLQRVGVLLREPPARARSDSACATTPAASSHESSE